MNKIKIGDKLQMHCYKHNGTLYRTCDEATVIDIGDTYLVCGNYKTKISEKETIESEHFHSYKTSEVAIMYFYKDKWFNVIGQFKKKGIYFYCNMASPYIIDDGLIKYIDYDLDLRGFPNGAFTILDRDEYRYNKKKYNYGEDIDKILKSELTTLINFKKTNTGPFDKVKLQKYYDKYISILNGENKFEKK